MRFLIRLGNDNTPRQYSFFTVWGYYINLLFCFVPAGPH